MLTRLNRTLTATSSGAVVPFAWLEIRVRSTNALAQIYSDDEGLNEIGNPVQADANGFIGVFLNPGIYKYEAKTSPSGTVLHVSDYEPVFNVIAASPDLIDITADPIFESIKNLGLIIFSTSGNVIIDGTASNGGNLSSTNYASVSFLNPVVGSVQTASMQPITDIHGLILTGASSFGAVDGESRTFYVYLCYNATDGVQFGIATTTNFDESVTHNTATLSTQSTTLINTPTAIAIPTSIRLVGKFTATRGPTNWVSTSAQTLFSGSNTFINEYARTFCFNLSQEMSNALIDRDLTSFRDANTTYTGARTGIFSVGNDGAVVENDGMGIGLINSSIISTQDSTLAGVQYSSITSSINCNLAEVYRSSIDSSIGAAISNATDSKISSSAYSEIDGYNNVTILSSRAVAARADNTVVMGFNAGTTPDDANITIEFDIATGNATFVGSLEVGGSLTVDGNLLYNPKNNLTATTNPTVNDDISEGYSPLSNWINISTTEKWQCITNTEGAAHWELGTLTTDDLGNVALLNANAIGQNIIQLPNPSAIRYLKVNADNSVTLRSDSEMRGDLSLGSAALLTAVSSEIDTTAGRALTVGYAGWGRLYTPSSQNANDLVVPGAYQLTTGAPGDFSNYPSWAAPSRSSVLVLGNKNPYGVDVYFDRSNGRSGYRVWNTTGSSWKEYWTDENLVKTTSATDTTAGRMLKVGDGGLLGVTPTVPGNTLANVDNSTGSGFYTFSSTTTGAPIATSGHTIWLRRTSGGGEAQINIAESSRRVFVNTRVTGAWGSSEFWTTDNLAKTTSATDATAGRVMVNGVHGVGSITAQDLAALSTGAAVSAIPNSFALASNAGVFNVAYGIPFSASGIKTSYNANRGTFIFTSIGGSARGGFVSSSADNTYNQFAEWWTSANLVKVTSANDNTVGSVVTTEWKGLGGIGVLLTDYNTSANQSTGLRNEFFIIDGAMTNRPAGVSASSMGINFRRQSSANEARLLFSPSDTANAGKMYFSYRASSAFQTAEIYTTHNTSANVQTMLAAANNAAIRTAISAPEYQEQVVELGGDFGIQEVKCIRIGNLVTITTRSLLSHSAGTSASSSIGVIPSQFRNGGTVVTNTGQIISSIASVIEIESDGTFTIRYYDTTTGSATTSDQIYSIQSVTYAV